MKKLKINGKNISRVEITNISTHGIWLFREGKEYFLPYEEFPWFKDAKISQIFNVDEVSEGHLYWPDLDIDLHIEIIEHPENYPLRARRRQK